MPESIMRRQIHHESMPPISPRTIFAWEVDQQGVMVLRHFYTTAENCSLTMTRIEAHRVILSSFKTTKMTIPFGFQTYTLPDKLDTVMGLLPDHKEEVEVVHVVYQSLTPNKATAFTLYHYCDNRWRQHCFPAPDYDSWSYDFEYFVLRSHTGLAVEVTPLWDMNHEIAIHLGHGYINIL